MRLQPYNIIYKHAWTTVSHSRVTLVIFNGGSKGPTIRKKNIGPPAIYYKNCHNDKELMLQSNELRIIDGRLTIVQVPQVKHFEVIGEITLILLGQLMGSKGI
jgi:hypothetical protein